ncbi:MAG: hypothetical protein LBC88_01335 [Spirochaetaceae bacterium]|jgi:hypothetical protein|nr:hypothetical protein [Spirochaetaceae bacterium]
MSTIPSIFDSAVPSYTAVGGAERAATTGLAAVVLNRGSRYPRRTLFQELEKIGFDFIVSLEGPQERYDVEELSLSFPSVRFILLKEALTPGEQINLAAAELSCPLFFVLWNDLRVLHSGGAARMAARIFRTPEEIRSGLPGTNRRLCTAPLIQNARFEALPTFIAPALYRRTVRTVPFAVEREGTASLYPFDGVGIYDRDRFFRIGGFDGSLKSLHWQLMDFGFRAWLWGEEIRSTALIRLSYNGDSPSEDSTAEESYRRFYLRSLAPVFRGGEAHLPLLRFWDYLFRAGVDPFSALKEFAEGRRWVYAHRSRFQRDARMLTRLWEDPRETSVPSAPAVSGDGPAEAALTSLSETEGGSA